MKSRQPATVDAKSPPIVWSRVTLSIESRPLNWKYAKRFPTSMEP